MNATSEPRQGLHTTLAAVGDNTTGNNFLGNGGTELNTTSQVYDLQFRNYDPILGRMNQVDPLADRFGSHSPYNYSFNNPITFNDVNGAKPGPWSADFAESYTGDDYGSRNSWSKMVAHGGMWQFVGGPGEGWGGYVGNYGLAGGGFGFGDSYAQVSRLAMARNDALSSTDGGSIDTRTGKVSFYNSNEAFAAGYAYNEYHNSWSTTVMGSAYASVGNYQTIQELSSTVARMLIADNGPGPGYQYTRDDGTKVYRDVNGHLYYIDADGTSWSKGEANMSDHLPGGKYFLS